MPTRQTAPPAGTVRPLRRRASEALKPPCPWCGSPMSSVYDSCGDKWKEVYHRRRQCGECLRDWPTIEGLNREKFAKELAAVGKTLADLGLTD